MIVLPVTYRKIASVTVTGATQASLEFTNIPATYTDLVILYSARSNRTGDPGDPIRIEVNGSSSNLTYRFLRGGGSSADSSSGSTGQIGRAVADATASTFSNGQIYIPNYAGNTNKSMSGDSVTENNATAAYQEFYATLWSQTAAITSLTLKPVVGSNFVTYTSAILYGIKKD